ncbi:MAG TPA: WD40 repeat domain-containing protein, partial [Pseudonocardiaceae bacterium]|nr:WD40 repeat domain-containing protein [Pseudonocardiaceae bacterium]
MSPDARLLVTDSPTAIRLWMLNAGAHRAHVVGSVPHLTGGMAQDAEFSPDGSRLLLGFVSSPAELWDTSDPMRPVLIRRTFDDGVGAFGSDRYLITEGAEDELWDLTDPGHPTRAAALPGSTVDDTATVSQDGRTVVQLDGDAPSSRLRLWDISVRQPRLVWQTAAPGHPDLLALRGSLLAVATDTGVRLWDIAHAGEPAYLGAVSAPSPKIVGIALSPDGTELAAAMDDAVDVWDVSTPSSPALIASFDDQGDEMPLLAFRSDSTLVTSDDPQGTGTPDDNEKPLVRWWNLPASGLSGRTVDGAISPAFSPDGRTMATSSTGGTQLWDVRQPASPVPLRS